MINSILKIVQGWVKLRGDTDGTFIGNVGDKLKVATASSNVQSTLNTTTTPLTSNDVFTGTGEDVTDYGVICIAIRSDQISATLGLEFQFSHDNSTWYTTDNYNYLATGVLKNYSLAPIAKYFRIKYTNGTTAQSNLLIVTVFRNVYAKPSSHRIGDGITSEDDSEVMQSVMMAKTPSGSFINIGTTTGGNLKSAIQEFDPAVLGQETMANSIPVVIASDQTINLTANKIDFVDNLKDAFGRLRVSNPANVMELVMYVDQINTSSNPTGKLYKSETNGGTASHNNTTKNIDLAVTTTTNSRVIVQTAEYYHYIAGKSQLVKFTGNMNGGVAAVNKFYGQFDDANGYFFKLAGTTLQVGIRSSVSGSVVDTMVSQSSWNIDKLDGTGASGKTIDMSKQQLMFIYYAWQGSGSVWYGFHIDGIMVPCHVVYHANTLTVNYSQTATLPLRAEMINTASSSSTMTMTCIVIDSEGGWNAEGKLSTMNQGSGTGRAYTTAGTKIPLLSLRKSTAGIKIPIEIIDAGIFANSADDFLVEFILNGTLTGASWSATGATTYTERDVSATAITGGKSIYSTYIRGNTNAASLSANNLMNITRSLFVGANIAGTSEIFSVVATNITANANANAFINFKEYI